MNTFNFKVKFKNRKTLEAKINKIVDDKFTRDFNNEVVEGVIKRMIASGLSPVRQFGRFDAYKDPKKYPGTYKALVAKKNGGNKTVTRFNKPARPVSLYLTGEMLKAFIARRKNERTITVGIDPNASKFVKTKALANNLGTERNGKSAVPERRFIPIKNEEWAVSVIRVAKKLFTNRIQQLLSKNK